MKPIAQAVTLKDGTFMSVQGSSGHYCTPQDDHGPYLSLEVLIQLGRKAPRSWSAYDTSGEPKRGRGGNGPHGYVPIRKIETLISRRGGIVSGRAWWRKEAV